MDKDYFVFNNKRYYVGTIIEIKQNKKSMFGFYSIVKFVQHDSANNMYYFTSLDDIWKKYKISEEQLADCIEDISSSVTMQQTTNKTLDPRYIDGIVDAWIWYILIIFFAFFFNGIENKIIAWIVASIVFFNWRNEKINGR